MRYCKCLFDHCDDIPICTVYLGDIREFAPSTDRRRGDGISKYKAQFILYSIYIK